ncbi:MAG: D-aminoacyl-tRNA deacylase [Anaerolineales bacterium]|nr:D-aminoacyl-tRNA deacylase [Anaerolineales bacterium]
MRAVVQRVTEGSVTVNGETVGQIEKGLVILLGVREDDTWTEARWLADKIANLRIFEDSDGKLNLSALDVGAETLVVPQFTLYGDASKGRRPSFTKAAHPKVAEPLCDKFAKFLAEAGLPVETGAFGAMMLVKIFNDGPVTIILDRDVD